MSKSKISFVRKKKIKSLLSMMNKQNQRLVPIAPPLIEMMDMTISDQELEFLLQMGTDKYDYDQAIKSSGMPVNQFRTFFDTIKQKGLVHFQSDADGKEIYRLGAVAVGWYEAMVHYLMGKPGEREFTDKFNDYFKYFRKFNFFPLRNIQNFILSSVLKPYQETGIMDPKIPGKNKRKTIPIGTDIPVPNQRVYPTSYVNDIIEEFGSKNQIVVFPCVCRHAKRLTGSDCTFEIPRESCIGLGSIAEAGVDWGYGRKISKEEALDILKEVRERGAVHSVIHERDDISLPVMAICNCCWDCCGLLKSYNMGAASLKYNASFAARIKDDGNCKGCGNCEKYCPTTAIKLKNDKVTLNSGLCIGCGQCAFQCRQNNIELYPNRRTVYLPLLKKSEARVAA